MLSVDFWVTFGFSVLMCLLHDWARLTLVDVFTQAFNFASTSYQKLDRNSASENSVAPEDATNTTKDGPLHLGDLGDEDVHSTNHLSCGSMDMPSAIVPHDEKLSVNPLSSQVQTQPYCSSNGATPEGTHGDLDTKSKLAVSNSAAKIDLSSAAFETAIDAALTKKFGSLEACLDARRQPYIDTRLRNPSEVCATSAVFKEKLSELEAVIRRESTKLGEYHCMLMEELHRVANKVCEVVKDVQAVSDGVTKGFESTSNFQDKQYSKDDLHNFCAASQEVRNASAVISNKIQELSASGLASDHQDMITHGEHLIDNAVRITEDAHPMRLQVSTARLDRLTALLKQATLFLNTDGALLRGTRDHLTPV
jgi:hypothetical protein